MVQPRYRNVLRWLASGLKMKQVLSFHISEFSIPVPFRTMQFTAKLLGGKDDLVTIDLLPKVQVRHLKMKIADEMLLPCGSFKVLNAGKPLNDDDLQLAEAGLKDGAKLTVVINIADAADSNPAMEARLKTILGDSATPLNMLRLRRSIQNYVDFMSLDDLERFARKRTDC